MERHAGQAQRHTEICTCCVGRVLPVRGSTVSAAHRLCAAAHRLCAAALCWPHVGCWRQRCIGRASAVRGSAVSAVCRQRCIGCVLALRNSAVSTTCLASFHALMYSSNGEQKNYGIFRQAIVSDVNRRGTTTKAAMNREGNKH